MSETVTKNEVTPEKFAEFLAWLSPDLDKSGDEYERLRFRLTTFFAQRNIRFAEDLADETINRVTLKIGETVIENKFAYIYGVAKFVFLESVRKEKSHLNIDDLNIAATSPKADENEFSDKCLDKCLAELASNERSLILDYFSEEKQAKIDLHKKISESLNLTKTALRMKIVRIKRKLKNCLQECAT